MECKRVLKYGGYLLLNVKDHYRNDERQHVTEWHMRKLMLLGFGIVEERLVETPSLRKGQNGQKRMPYESLVLAKVRS